MAKEYIERVDLENRLHALCAAQRITAQDAIDIAILPAADVAPVVLCCNCEHYKTFGCSIGCGWCEATGIRTYDDFFCAGGRWKSNGADMQEVQDDSLQDG